MNNYYIKEPTSFRDVILILKGKIADPHVDEKKKHKILEALRRQIDFVQPNHNYTPNWYKEMESIDNEMRALALSEDEE